MQQTTKVNEKSLIKSSPKCNIIRFAWGNEKLKTWFITKTQKAILPTGSRLMFKIKCKPVNEPISIVDSYPKKGQVVEDIDENRLKVINVEWY